MLQMVNSVIEIGLERPLKLLHVTDTHLSLCDARDDIALQEEGARNRAKLPDVEAVLDAQIAYAEAHCDLMVHTGDLIQFISQANLEKARAIVGREKVFFTPGNHDFDRRVPNEWEDAAYRMKSYRIMGGGFGVNMFFDARTLGGVNLVAVNNCYHQAEDWQTERLRMEAQKGLPIVLFMHAPLFEPTLFEYSLADHDHEAAFLMGCDEAHLLRYDEYHAMAQRPSEQTRRFIEYVCGEPAIRAIVAGHVHLNYESRLACGKTQFATDAGFRGACREITIV